MTREEAERVLTAAGQAGEAAFPLFDAAVACAIHELPDRDTAPAVTLMEEGVRRLGVGWRHTEHTRSWCVAAAMCARVPLASGMRLLRNGSPDV